MSEFISTKFIFYTLSRNNYCFSHNLKNQSITFYLAMKLFLLTHPLFSGSITYYIAMKILFALSGPKVLELKKCMFDIISSVVIIQ